MFTVHYFVLQSDNNSGCLHISTRMAYLFLLAFVIHTLDVRIYVIFASLFIISPLFTLLTLDGMTQIKWTRIWNFSAAVVFMNWSINLILYSRHIGEIRTAVAKTARKNFCTQAEQEQKGKTLIWLCNCCGGL